MIIVRDTHIQRADRHAKNDTGNATNYESYHEVGYGIHFLYVCKRNGFVHLLTDSRIEIQMTTCQLPQRRE